MKRHSQLLAMLCLCVLAAACGNSSSVADRAAATQAAGAPEPDFFWGVASSGFQSEGGTFDSNWQRRIDAGDEDPYLKSVDFRHRYKEDIELARQLGANTYRFGINWARVEPQDGVYDEAELAYYDDVIRSIRAAGMVPIPTLYHFVHPGWVADQGGWSNQKTVDDFVRLGALFANRWKQFTRWWLIFNEPACDIVNYIGPDLLTIADRFVQAHERVYDAIHAAVAGAMVSSNECSNNLPVALRLPLEQLLMGRMARDGKLDFIGIDVYYRADNLNSVQFLLSNGEPWTVPQQPYGMYEQLKDNHRRYPDLPLFVTENGMPTDNGLPRPDGITRADHLRDSIYWMQKAMSEGVPVLGYLYWSLTDNYEWGSYRPRFGLYTVDAVTDPALERRPTDAVPAYRCIIRNGGVPAAYRPVRNRDGSANGVTNPPDCADG